MEEPKSAAINEASGDAHGKAESFFLLVRCGLGQSPSNSVGGKEQRPQGKKSEQGGMRHC